MIAFLESKLNNGMCDFVGTFAKLRMTAIYFVMSVCPSIRLRGTTWLPLNDFYEIWFLSFFLKSVEKIQVSLKSDNNNGYFTWRPAHFVSCLAQLFSEWEKFQAKILEKIKTHFLCSVNNFFSENRAFYEMKWNNILAPDRSQMTKLCQCFCLYSFRLHKKKSCT